MGLMVSLASVSVQNAEHNDKLISFYRANFLVSLISVIVKPETFQLLQRYFLSVATHCLSVNDVPLLRLETTMILRRTTSCLQRWLPFSV